jgi:TonB-linked SusC/RagA family outer membrane protein
MKNSTFKQNYLQLLLKGALGSTRNVLLLIMLLSCIVLHAQERSVVTGAVVSSDDNSLLPGVTVLVKGTTRGTTTNDKGRYSLEAQTGDSLIFRYIGFVEKRIKVGANKTINISLQPESNQLSDVVVVAFGTKKKSDMVGSVTTIKPGDLKVPSSNLTTALAGRAAGVIAFQRSGEPGQDNAQFFIRGVTTFGYKKDPLILIDGVELSVTDLARLQVDDIASFSILKDASATALYGSRAANGVILVTTKGGAVGKAKLNFRVENSFSAPTKDIELADPITYMKLSNEAVLTRDPLQAPPYSDSKIDNTIAGTNPIAYPTNDWKKLMFKDYTTTQRFNLNVSGGGTVARYFVAGSYTRDNGLMNVDKRNNFNSNIKLNTYTLRSNVGITLTNTTEMTVRLSGSFDDYAGPLDGGASMYQKVMRSNPVLFPAYYPSDEEHKFVKHIMFGNYQEGRYINPYAEMVKGYKDYSRSLMLAQIELKQDLKAITKGLAASGMINTNRESYFDVSRFYNPFWYSLNGYDKLTDRYFITNTNPNTGTEFLDYKEGDKRISTSLYLESRLNYDRTFGKSGVSGMLVFMAQNRLNANAGNLQQSLPYRNLGLSGRATYDYDKRYYAEFNFGYNGSERFDQNHRMGFFPSFGLAWTVSNETFFKPISEIITNLRLRGTYGIIGNDAIGTGDDRFFYLSNIRMNDPNKASFFGRDLGTSYGLNGISTLRYANSDITWETSTQKNLALELSLFNKFNLTAEYFTQYRDHILMDRAAIPLAAGFAAPIRANVGVATAGGVDLSLDYKQFFKNNFWINIMGNFTYASSKFKVYEEPIYAEAYRYHAGNSINQEFGYIAEKLFTDDEEAANSPKQNFGPYGGGDIKYLDVNRDGKITEADRVPIGNPTVPEIVYGFGFSLGYKNFDISAFFQGLGNESFWIDPAATSPFAAYYYPNEIINAKLENQLLKAYADDHWSEDNRNVYALWPRLSPNVNQNNAQRSTWFMRDGSFLRLKQVEIGYALPANIQKRIRTSNCRIYINATNLLQFSKFDLWDAEMGGNGLGYPVQRVFNIGLNVGFN